ncbi:dihydroxyacetone kinase subunit DhaL [Terrilactibacillus laevilacticus]|uniref:Dihydroxyacetone kinase subunit DhaL n=1 Tax=Terrilactibacillus laevilacticus TaxID=1380157 RepID=A0ABW5PTW6_9BACI|nr:dihydroxyacetone kinase subunit DhaL [Terrilactibacillus laevilacticus]
MNIDSRNLINYFQQVVEMIEKEKDHLSELDRKLGDGDHGVTMSIGFQAVKDKLDHELLDEEDCSKICIVVARTFLSAVGSSVGPLYATGFLKGAKVIKNKRTLDDESLTKFWLAFVDGVKERGMAKVGDKTMVDTLEPAANILKEEFEKTGNFIEAFQYAVDAGRMGMESTQELLSRKGRSSRLGQRSLGVIDPGAASAYLLLNTFLTSLNSKRGI